MLAKLFSYTLIGIDATPVEVEVDVSAASMPKTVLVGLAEAAVKESTHRVERAIVNSGYRRPVDRVVINLAPADLKKDASGFDLPIALGLLLGSGQVAFDRPGNYAIVGDTLFDFSGDRTHKILLADLDIPATQKANDASGVEFKLPPEGDATGAVKSGAN